jgi:hypothetical protein
MFVKDPDLFNKINELNIYFKTRKTRKTRKTHLEHIKPFIKPFESLALTLSFLCLLRIPIYLTKWMT